MNMSNQKKEYYIANKEERKQYQKFYDICHRDKLKEYRHKYNI